MQKIYCAVLVTMVLVGCSGSLAISDFNTKELAQMTKIRQQVLETKPSGQEFSWSIKTLSGVMTVIKTTEQNGRFCRYLSETITEEKQDDGGWWGATLNTKKRPLNLDSLWCRRNQGGWVLQN